MLEIKQRIAAGDKWAELVYNNFAYQLAKYIGSYACVLEGKVDAVVVGADRIARNGDTANKIGTYGVAVLAREHGIPFYVAAPTSTIDASLDDGSEIVIEQRSADEVLPDAIDGVDVWNPAFDVTPAKYITRIITERGVFEPSQLAETL